MTIIKILNFAVYPTLSAQLLDISKKNGGPYIAQTDLRVVKTLRQIDHSLLECLADTPFEKITVEQLCRGALINRSTF